MESAYNKKVLTFEGDPCGIAAPKFVDLVMLAYYGAERLAGVTRSRS